MHQTQANQSCEILLAQVAGGDRASLAALFEMEAPRLLAVAGRILRQLDRAEDVVQEAFVSIWRSAARFDPTRGSARVWMTTIVRNRALNAIRNDDRIEFHDGETLADLGDRAADANDAFRQLADRDALKLCLGALDEPKRRVILLAYVTGLNHGEIAGVVGAPLGTVKAWIRRGVVALQECLS